MDHRNERHKSLEPSSKSTTVSSSTMMVRTKHSKTKGFDRSFSLNVNTSLPQTNLDDMRTESFDSKLANQSEEDEICDNQCNDSNSQSREHHHQHHHRKHRHKHHHHHHRHHHHHHHHHHHQQRDHYEDSHPHSQPKSSDNDGKSDHISSSLLNSKLKSSPNMMLCPLMRNYSMVDCNDSNENHSHQQHSYGRESSSNPMATIETASPKSIKSLDLVHVVAPETPTDGDKIDLKHISMALMRLLYPKVEDIFEILERNFRFKINWNSICEQFERNCSINSIERKSSKERDGRVENFERTNGSINHPPNADDDDDYDDNSCRDSVHNRGEQNMIKSNKKNPNKRIVRNASETNEINEEIFLVSSENHNHNNNIDVDRCNNDDDDDQEQNYLHSKFPIDSIQNYLQLQSFSKFLAQKQSIIWEELIVEIGEKYAIDCLRNDSNSLRFLGENLVEFFVNIENIQSIAYKQVCEIKNFDHSTWPVSQPDLLPITVFVNHCETQLIITYNISEPICHFVAFFLAGLFRKIVRNLFKIVIKVKVEIGSDQYKFIIENFYPKSTLIDEESVTSRYKRDLNNRPEQLVMAVDTFRKVFPFHFVCDQNLRLIQYGTGMGKILGAQNKINVHISNLFQIVQPNVGFFFESIRHRINLAFVLRIRDQITNENFRGMQIQGQIIECVESKCLLFLGTPIVKGLQSLTSRGLFLSDIPIHDATRDIILMEEQSRAQESLKRRMDKLKDSIQKANKAVEIERQKNVDLLNLIFPALVAKQLWLGKAVRARQYDDVTMLFSDIVGFTSICSSASPMAIINMLNELYTQFDVFCGEIDVYKTETIGDAYCVASGLHRRTKYHAVLAAFMALRMMEAVDRFQPKDINVEKFQVRIEKIYHFDFNFTNLSDDEDENRSSQWIMFGGYRWCPNA
ncbi:hypothetical protein NH340_JMT08752 [Sarcoptes scabiei]|nr:hypothetical protein NH340_JMT08752 [Sarcoptes scabiei]